MKIRKNKDNNKTTLYIDKNTAKRGAIIAAVRGVSFSALVANMINDAYNVKHLINEITASDISENK